MLLEKISFNLKNRVEAYTSSRNKKDLSSDEEYNISDEEEINSNKPSAPSEPVVAFSTIQ